MNPVDEEIRLLKRNGESMRAGVRDLENYKKQLKKKQNDARR